ncbi:FKBP-type peptidyl-prolyl cis-trans isomerase [Spirosoma gilvum]
MRTIPLFFLGLLLICGLTSCSNSTVDPSQDANTIYQANLADIKTYTTAKGLTGTTTSTGLFFAPLKVNATGLAATYGTELEFNYRLYALYGPSNSNGASGVTDKLLDTTYLSTPVYRNFYQGVLLPGLEEGLLKMHEGDQAVMIMPSVLAFGNGSTSDLPANSPVRFDVKLNRVRTEDQQMDEYMTTQKMTPTEVTSTGLRFIKTQSNPTGQTPGPTQTLVIKYRGQLLRATPSLRLGTAFDSTGTGTLASTATQFIPGFSEGLSKLKVGEKATIIFASKLGYAEKGVTSSTTATYIIPPYAPLRFDIELVSVQ